MEGSQKKVFNGTQRSMMEKSPLQLSSIYAENFRNLVFHQPLKLNNLNVLVGSNGSGKSNFLNLVFFLNRILMGGFGQTAFDQLINKMGGISIVNKAQKDKSIRLSFGWKSPNNNRASFNYDLSFSFEKNRPYKPYLTLEKLFTPEKIILIADHLNKEGTVDLAEKTEIPRYGSLLLKDLTSHFFQERHIEGIEHLIESILMSKKYNACDMSIKRISTEEPKSGMFDKYVSSEADDSEKYPGANLALVIKNLSEENVDFEDILNEAMCDILPNTKKVKAIAPRSNVHIDWYFKQFQDPFYLDEMSDGTVRMLCWATILLSPDPPKLIILDEPELGLHPAWMKPLGRWIKRAAQKTQVILSTHSPDLLDQFTDNWENVIRFDQEPNGTDYTPVSLADQKALKKSIEEEGFELGDLYRAGDPSLGGWPW
jgi:predicted ATPase